MNTRLPTLVGTLSLAGLLGWIATGAASDDARRVAPPQVPERATTPQERTGGSAVPCAVPLAWRVARVDPEFGLDLDEVSDVLSAAAALWEDGAGRNLFRHDPENGFPVRVVYDERQAQLGERLGRQRELEALGRELRAARDDVVARGERLRAQTALHRDRASDVERRIADHNAAVREINADGGTTDARRAELEAIGDALRREQEAVMAERPVLQAEEASLREAERALNARIEEHRQRTDRLNASFPPLSVEAGEYRERVEMRDGRLESVSREIRLYRFGSEADLRAVAAHELGHALGLGHTDDPGGVMSAETRSNASPAALAESDLALLDAVCPRDG